MVFEPRLVDDMSISTTLQDLDASVLPGVRQPIVKLKLLPLDGRTFLNLNIQVVIPQVKYYDSIHLTLPDELRPILREKDAGKQQKRR